MKLCNGCKILKPLIDFHKRKGSKLGVKSECKICRNIKKQKYRNANKDLINKKQAVYCQNNPEKVKLSKLNYRLANKSRIRDYARKSYRENIQFRLRSILRNRLFHAINRNQKVASAVASLGCTVEFLKAYLESKFKPGMSWKNYGEWHIDHIKPLSSFDLTDLGQFKEACHYSNLQPLWAIDNLKKGAKYE